MYLYDLLNTDSSGESGIVRLTVPLPTNKGGNSSLKGVLLNPIRVEYKNKWDSVIPGLETLSQVSQLFGTKMNGNVIAWVNGSSAAWSGTDPVRIQVEFMLITLSSNQNILGDIGSLASLASLTGVSGNQITTEWTVHVHNGYYNDFWESNGEMMGMRKGVISEGSEKGTYSSSAMESSASTEDRPGTVSISTSGLEFTNLLLENLSVEPSREKVMNGNPLYIKATANFRGVRSCLITDIDKTYNTSLSGTTSKGTPDSSSNDNANGSSNDNPVKYGNIYNTEEKVRNLIIAYNYAYGRNGSSAFDKNSRLTEDQKLDMLKNGSQYIKNMEGKKLWTWTERGRASAGDIQDIQEAINKYDNGNSQDNGEGQ